jgi:hypothetical protein
MLRRFPVPGFTRTGGSARMLPLLALLALAAGCAKGDPYAIETPAATLAAGAAGHAEIRFLPGAGFKWNDEFPARLKIADAGTARVAKPSFAQADGDFTVGDGIGSLRIPVTAGAAGTTALKGTADFSVCNDDECRIFRAVPIEIPLEVR